MQTICALIDRNVDFRLNCHFGNAEIVDFAPRSLSQTGGMPNGVVGALLISPPASTAS